MECPVQSRTFKVFVPGGSGCPARTGPLFPAKHFTSWFLVVRTGTRGMDRTSPSGPSGPSAGPQCRLGPAPHPLSLQTPPAHGEAAGTWAPSRGPSKAIHCLWVIQSRHAVIVLEWVVGLFRCYCSYPHPHIRPGVKIRTVVRKQITEIQPVY